MLNELDIINKLQIESQGFVGDDAAILPNIKNSEYVISKDLLIEDVHFRCSYFSPENLASKVLNVNLSDIAAMGATPKYILCGISIPNNNVEYYNKFLDYLVIKCKELGIILIGGDTTKSPDKLYISITVIGLAENINLKYRNNAKIGDKIFIAGNLGWSNLGFLSLENNINIYSQYVDSFLNPKAKILEGIWLGKQKDVNSMMDVSDGLYIDLLKLCKSSNCMAIINMNKINIDNLFIENCKKLSVDPTTNLFSGGEDYGLLFTVSNCNAQKLYKQFYNNFGYKLIEIGNIVEGEGVKFYEDNKEKFLNIKPFTHFGEEI